MARHKKHKSKTIEIYKHKTQKRKNNPQVGAVTSETDNPKVKTKKYKYDPNIDPELRWAGKAERLSFEAPTVPLHIHEKIDPRSIIETVRSRNSVDYEQMSLFHDPTERRPLEKEIEFYKHEKLWSNRLIAGDSLVVMNSLLQKEGMAGKVQCIYIDPPYGIKYGSNFQPFINKRDVKDKKDEDLTAEPEMIKAFRDTWELGIHSYLTYLRDRLFLAKELLTESGSCFVQISDENVHLVRNLMDEVFGVNNYVSTIIFRKKKMPLGAKYLEYFCDYILFYSKNINNLKFHRLFRFKDMQGDSKWCFVQLSNGERRRMTPEEHKNHSLLPKESKIYLRQLITPAGLNQTGLFPVRINGKTIYPPKGKSWKTSKTGMNKLIRSQRVELSENDKTLNYVMFLDDYPVTSINALWYDTSGAHNQKYVVETSPTVIQRCMLMTTDPGDLVLDPTCGSGTTAYVAEKWGRRWITCDTSRVAVALAKQRLMTANFDYYKLTDNKQGVSGGFNYKEVPHITLKSIANNPDIREDMTKQEIESAIARHAPKEKLVDQPHIDRSKFRVSGPFTVEAIPAVKVETLSGEMLNGVNSIIKQDWFHALKEHGIKGKKGLSKDIEFTRLEMISDTQYIYGEGEIKETGKRAIVCFGSEFAPLEQRQVEEALKEAKPFRPDIVIFCAFQFDPEAGKDVDELDLKWTKVLKVQMNSDLLTHDLKKKTKGESFWLVGQPDVKVQKIVKGEHKGKYTVRIQGFDYYNTKTNELEKGGKDKIAIWMLDTNYDERSLYPRQVFFPLSGNKDGWEKLKKSLKSELNLDLMDKFKGTEAIPFKAENHKKMAIKIIDDRGIESLIIKTLD
ncbi:MAG: DNA methyltransferase [Bdellovibrionales bacterium]|nr:DNA methyltransferase [Bdellovibrionales bacterium]